MSETSSACAMPADLMPPNFDAILEFAFLNANCHSIHFLFYDIRYVQRSCCQICFLSDIYLFSSIRSVVNAVIALRDTRISVLAIIGYIYSMDLIIT